MVRNVPKLVLWSKRLTQGWSEIMIMKYKQGIHFILSYRFDQKAGITFSSFFNF